MHNAGMRATIVCTEEAQGLVRCCKSHESRHHYHHLIIMIVLIEEHHKASSFIAIIGWLVGWLAISQAANYSK